MIFYIKQVKMSVLNEYVGLKMSYLLFDMNEV
jgi:hypothetical protein